VLGEVRQAHRFDQAALSAYLRRQIGDHDALTIQQFDAGQSNPTFLVNVDDTAYVLRKKPPGQLLPKAHMIEREYTIMKALADTDVPVPKMIWLCEDEEVIGTPFFLMEYVKGRVFWDATFPNTSPAERRALFDEMNRVLAALHSVNYQKVGLENYGRPGNYFARQISIWTRQYQASMTENIPSMNHLIEWLPANIPEEESTTIVHGDYRLDNMIFHPTEARVITLLDWELSTLGHPLADLAYNCMGFVMDSPYHKAINSVAGPESGIPTVDAYIAQYCARTGRAGIEQWNFYLAFSIFRSAAIIQGVYKRGLQGNASSSRALQLGPMVRRGADIAWGLVS
jgi:aminoglycoside phosphotransferase (APT) family kinase protein